MTKRMILIVLATVVLVGSMLCFTGCRESDRASYNVSKEADNFNVMRRLAVINTVEGKPVFEMIGRFSITADEEENQLEVIVEVKKGTYKKHIIGLNDATTMYVIEDINGADVSPYRYEINYLPQAIIPFTITSDNIKDKQDGRE